MTKTTPLYVEDPPAISSFSGVRTKPAPKASVLEISEMSPADISSFKEQSGGMYLVTSLLSSAYTGVMIYLLGPQCLLQTQKVNIGMNFIFIDFIDV